MFPAYATDDWSDQRSDAPQQNNFAPQTKEEVHLSVMKRLRSFVLFRIQQRKARDANEVKSQPFCKTMTTASIYASPANPSLNRSSLVRAQNGHSGFLPGVSDFLRQPTDEKDFN